MKRFIRVVCVIVALVTFLAVPASAYGSSQRSSSYIAAYSAYFWESSASYQFQVWFEVTGTDTMDEIGTNEIIVQGWNSLKKGWDTIKVYHPEEYPNMIARNTSGHVSYVTCDAPPGYFYYRAIVTIYAKKGNGFGEIYTYPDFYYYS